jgi:hypothetical protein
MTDTGQVVSSVEDDQNFRPWIILWLNGLFGMNIMERMFPLLPGDVSDIYHIHILDLERELFLAIIDLAWAGLYPHYEVGLCPGSRLQPFRLA